MLNYTSFISDLHLAPEFPERTRCFEHYITHITPHCDALYILGDLFNCYLGKAQFPDFYDHILSILIKASESTTIYFLPGNRDYLSQWDLFQHTPIQCIPDRTIIDVYGARTLLSHGDRFQSYWHAYQWYRKATQYPWFSKALLSLPQSFLWKKGRNIRANSQHKRNQQQPSLDHMANPVIMHNLAQHNHIKRIIHGHLHVPHIIERPGFQHIILGEWLNEPHHLLIDQHQRTTLETVEIRADGLKLIDHG